MPRLSCREHQRLFAKGLILFEILQHIKNLRIKIRIILELNYEKNGLKEAFL